MAKPSFNGKKSYRKTKSARSLLNQVLLSEWADETVYDANYVDVCMALAEDVNSSLSVSIYTAIKYKHFDQLLSLTCNPEDYSNPEDYYKDNLLVSFIKKYPLWDTSHNTKEVAAKTFISCENKCFDTNRRFLDGHNTGSKPSDQTQQVMLLAQRKIAEILGSVPDIGSLPFEFGPGASYSVKIKTSSYYKITGALDVTPEAKQQAIELLQSCPGWLSLHGVNHDENDRIADCLTFIPGDRLSFVPKSAKTERPIAIGPTLNVLIQKGFGTVIRKKLKRHGVNLNRNSILHKELARMGSLTGAVSTIDLVSASDLISWAVVADLLPVKWLEALHTCRSGKYTVDGKRWYEYSKFSAMGNGYTFELESLIFYALAYACTKIEGLNQEHVSVHGDDIILPTGASHAVICVLEHCGFEINKEKSFYSGPFRESCGGDFFHGMDVRGFSVKGAFRLSDIVRFRNYLYRTGYRFYFKRTWRLLRQLLKKYEQHLAGPDDGQDDHIVFDDYDCRKPFYYCSQSFAKRDAPKHWNKTRVWMLYDVMCTPVPPLVGNQASGVVQVYRNGSLSFKELPDPPSLQAGAVRSDFSKWKQISIEGSSKLLITRISKRSIAT